MTKKNDPIVKDFELTDIIQVMATPCGRRTIAAILELCMYEESAMATNATALAANVSRQEVAHQLKNWIWEAGGKKLWRIMEDITDLQGENNEEAIDDDEDDYDLGSSLED